MATGVLLQIRRLSEQDAALAKQPAAGKHHFDLPTTRGLSEWLLPAAGVFASAASCSLKRRICNNTPVAIGHAFAAAQRV